MGLLETTLAYDAAVGTNLRGDASGGGWLYCLPRLTFDHVVALGAPGSATLAGLARAGTRVSVLADGVGPRRRLRALVRSRGWDHVDVRPWRRAEGLPSAPTIDLLVVGATGTPTRRRAEQLTSRMGVDAVAYYGSTWTAGHPDHGERLTLAVTPSHGEVRGVIPAGDSAMRSAFTRMGLEGTIMKRPKLSRWEREVKARIGERLGIRGWPRFGTVVAGPVVDVTGVPTYLRTIAAADDLPLDGWSYGVSARGDYDSQKVLVLLTPPGQDAPTVVVKITRSEEHSARLLNEGAVLRLLAQVDVAAGRAPLAWFSGFHAGRAVLGESRLDGGPYTIPRERGTRTRHAQLDDALGWLTDLAAATSHPVPSADMASVLLTLLGRFEQVYSPRPGEVAALRERFEELSTLSATMPSVLQHGDPGIWNLLVDDDGRTMFLDWEAGEPDGMPLWDLLYLFRSHAIEAGRRAGVTNRVEAAARDLFGDGPLAGVFGEAVDAYVTRLGLPPAAIPALTLGCWVHRALKEAARSAPGRLDEGLSVQLIRRMLAASSDRPADRPAPPSLDR